MELINALAQKIYYVWGIIAGLGAIIFGAGMVVEKTKTDRFVTKEVREADLRADNAEFNGIRIQLTGIETSLKKVTDWIDEVRPL